MKQSNAVSRRPVPRELLRKTDAHRRDANQLSPGRSQRYETPLPERKLRRDHVKSRMPGHRGTTPGLDFIDPDRATRPEDAGGAKPV